MRKLPLDDDARGEGRFTFKEFLLELKTNGCGLLLTGETRPSTRAYASRRLFGTTDPTTLEPHRHRILVLADPNTDPDPYLPGDTTPDDDRVKVVEGPSTVRSAAAAEKETEVADVGTDDELDALFDRVSTAVAELTTGKELQPSQLRVGVTSLRPLFAEFSDGEVIRFAEEVAELGRSEAGMVHLHFPAKDNSHRVLDVSRFMNARIQLWDDADGSIMALWRVPYPELEASLDWVEWRSPTE